MEVTYVNKALSRILSSILLPIPFKLIYWDVDSNHETLHPTNCFYLELYIGPNECNKLTKIYTTQIYVYIPRDYPFSPPTIMLEDTVRHPLVNVTDERDSLISKIVSFSEAIILDILDFFDNIVDINEYIPSPKIYQMLSSDSKSSLKYSKKGKLGDAILYATLTNIVLNDDKSLNVEKSKDNITSSIKIILDISDDVETVNITMCSYCPVLKIPELIMNTYCIILESLEDERNSYLIDYINNQV